MFLRFCTQWFGHSITWTLGGEGEEYYLAQILFRTPQKVACGWASEQKVFHLGPVGGLLNHGHLVQESMNSCFKYKHDFVDFSWLHSHFASFHCMGKVCRIIVCQERIALLQALHVHTVSSAVINLRKRRGDSLHQLWSSPISADSQIQQRLHGVSKLVSDCSSLRKRQV